MGFIIVENTLNYLTKDYWKRKDFNSCGLLYENRDREKENLCTERRPIRKPSDVIYLWWRSESSPPPSRPHPYGVVFESTAKFGTHLKQFWHFLVRTC